MWSVLIVLSSPDFSQHFCFLQRCEDFSVEEFVSEFSVEALDVTVLPGAARLDEQSLDTQPREPLPDGFGHELGSVVRADVFRDTVSQHQPGQSS